MTTNDTTAAARVGDRLEARGLHGQPSRAGQILEILGRHGHERYRVRWEDDHESVVFPADGVTVRPYRHARAGRR